MLSFLEPAARSDPVRQHAHEQCLAVGAAGDEGREAIVFAHVVAIVVQVLPILLQAGPAHGVDDRQRTVVARRNRIADGNIVENKSAGFLGAAIQTIFRRD